MRAALDKAREAPASIKARILMAINDGGRVDTEVS
jgi:hypothetical protein